jgi:DNA-binding IscR family transcriptional regulator
MQFSSRFPVAVYSLLIIDELSKDKEAKATSELIAIKIGNNAVTVRRILSDLKKAGYINIASSKSGGGASLAKPLNEITLLDILDLVEPNIPERVFSASKGLGQSTDLGIASGEVLKLYITGGINAFRDSFSTATMADFLAEIKNQSTDNPST